MKINEIFDTTEKSVSTKTPFKKNYDLNKFDDPNAGWYSHVVGDKDPHMVNKISHRHDPAYSYFVEYLIKNKIAQDNPHFPRIYDVSKYTDKNGQSKYKWQMERLKITLYKYISIDNSAIAKERMRYIGEIYLTDTGVKDLEYSMAKQSNIAYTVNDFCNYIIDPQYLQDNAYKDAIKIVEKMKQAKHGVFMDLHGNNLMLRFGPYAPQLVIIDPFVS